MSKPILIYVSSFDPRSGGSVVLHKLASVMRSLGADARLWFDGSARVMCSKFDTVIGNGTCDPKDSCVIYPEITEKNPLESPKVVRWLLNKPGRFGTVFTYDQNDIIVAYSPRFAFDKSQDVLRVFESWKDVFRPIKCDRSGWCYTLRKADQPKDAVLPFGEIIQPRDFTLESLRDTFAKHETFYSYDQCTMLSLFASMMGCDSIVHPDERTRQEWVRDHPLSRYGIAWGDVDLDRAKRTRFMIHEWLDEQELESTKTVERILDRLC